MEYAILVLPTHNRVYRDQAPTLAVGELTVLDRFVFGGILQDIRVDGVAGLPCISFSAPQLSRLQLAHIRTLSFCYGCFSREGELLGPVELPGEDWFDDDILTILKYPGKTNETFTTLLYNITLWMSAFGSQFFERLRVLDPVCGRGTTLYYALLRGHNADGVEVAKSDVQVIDSFLARYLQEHSYKHEIERGKVSRAQGGTGLRFSVRGARDKVELKTNPFTLNVINDDTVALNSYFGRNSYHAVVADLPYGVQHGGSGPGRGYIGAGELLERALPVWAKVLKKGGAMGLSWNANSLARSQVLSMLDAAGFVVPTLENSFEHRVDQAVVRDLVVATKTKP